jgi:hypothetical protein
MKKVITVVIFGIAFGLVEAAIVVYLRKLLNIYNYNPSLGRDEVSLLIPGIAFLEPKTALQIIQNSQVLNVERAREFATLVMLGTVAMLSAKKLGKRLAFFFLSFGVWDIFYYIFLKTIIGWPASLGDLDIFFLLPTPWVGPVMVPIVLSMLMIVVSTLYILRK